MSGQPNQTLFILHTLWTRRNWAAARPPFGNASLIIRVGRTRYLPDTAIRTSLRLFRADVGEAGHGLTR
jgi:hypothetical protein